MSTSASSDRLWPPILMYHSIEDTEQDPYAICVPLERFEEQLTGLARRGYRGVSVTEWLRLGAAASRERLVVLTFDDGYQSVLLNALPVLRRLGFGATVYMVAGRMGGDNDWDPLGPRRRMLTADELAQLAENGLEIGSHGLAHRSCLELSEAELAADLTASRGMLESLLGRPVRSYCYPFGLIDDRAVRQVGQAGFESAVGIAENVGADPLRLPRIFMGRRDRLLRLQAKRLRQAWRLRATTAGGAS